MKIFKVTVCLNPESAFGFIYNEFFFTKENDAKKFTETPEGSDSYGHPGEISEILVYESLAEAEKNQKNKIIEQIKKKLSKRELEVLNL